MIRREFLLLALAPVARAQESLIVLPSNSVERLKLAFNTQRNLVRLLMILSPT